MPDTTPHQLDIEQPMPSSAAVLSELASDGEAPHRSRRFTDFGIASLIAIFLSLVYLWRMLPGVGFAGDTIKFQFVGPTGGTAHETGYPIYLMLTWVAARVPVGDVAWRVNAMSSVFGVVACVLAYFVLRRLKVSAVVAAAFAIALGLTPVVLLYAVVAEVYTLHMALMLGMLQVLLAWQEDRHDWQLYLLLVLVSLSFSNHMTTALLVPGIVAFLWKVDRRKAFAPRMVAGAVTAALVAMLFYGYLIWRAADSSVFYLEIMPKSFGDLLDVWLGGRFRGKVFTLPLVEVLTDRLPQMAFLLGVSFVIVAPLLVHGYRQLRGSGVLHLLVWWTGATLIFSIGYDIVDIPPYLIGVFVAFNVVAAVGARPFVDRWIPSGWVRATMLVAAVAAIASPVLALSSTNWSEAATFESDMEHWLTDLPQDSVLAADYREAMAAWNLISIGGVDSSVEVLFVELEDLDGDHKVLLDSYMRGNAGYSRRLRQVIEPGKDAYAATDHWMCDLVYGGFALTEVEPRLYRVASARYEVPIADRWSSEMRDICIEINPAYGEL